MDVEMAYKFKLVLKTTSPANFELGFGKSKRDRDALWKSIKGIEHRFPSIDCREILEGFDELAENTGKPIGLFASKIHVAEPFSNGVYTDRPIEIPISRNQTSGESYFTDPEARKEKMSLSDKQIKKIEEKLKNSIREKFEKYNPEPAVMPFHTRLLGKDRLALYQFIHSLNTNFGTTIFEPVAAIAARKKFDSVKNSETAGKQISQKAQSEIQNIMNELTTGATSPDKLNEIERIRKVSQEGEMVNVKPTKVDLKLESGDNIYLFDIKTAKPNAGSFKEFKRTLLEWAAVTFVENPDANIHTLVAIPYNPYAPKPYERWTIRGMLDLDHDLKVDKEFWDFLGGNGTYEELLCCFERVGIELRDEIDEYFHDFNKIIPNT